MWDPLAIKDDIRGLNSKLDLVLTLLNRVLKQENTMALDLTKMNAEIAANTTVTSSVVALVNNLASQIAALSTSDPATQAQIDALVQTLASNDTTIASAVTANTPAQAAAAAAGKTA